MSLRVHPPQGLHRVFPFHLLLNLTILIFIKYLWGASNNSEHIKEVASSVKNLKKLLYAIAPPLWTGRKWFYSQIYDSCFLCLEWIHLMNGVLGQLWLQNLKQIRWRVHFYILTFSQCLIQLEKKMKRDGREKALKRNRYRTWVGESSPASEMNRRT